MQSSTDQGIKHFGFYRGVVLKHEDNGRCKIFIPGVYPDSFGSSKGVNDLPSAEQAAPLFGGLTKGDGTFSYPHINSVVWCFFQNGDQNLPVYFAAALGGPGAIEDDPKQTTDRGWSSIRDNVSDEDAGDGDTTLNGEDSEKHLVEIGDTKILWEENGTITIQVRDPDYKNSESVCSDEYIQSEVIIQNNGFISLNANFAITIHAPNIMLDAKDCIGLNSAAILINGDEAITMTSDQVHTVADTHFITETPVAHFNCAKGSFTAVGQKSSVNAM